MIVEMHSRSSNGLTGDHRDNAFPSTPTTRMGGTAERTSPIGRWHNSGRITGTTPSASGTSFIMSTVCSITRHIGSGIRRTSSGTCRTCHTRRTSGSLLRRGSGWGRFTSVMRMWRSIRSVLSKHRVHNSIGVWRR